MAVLLYIAANKEYLMKRQNYARFVDLSFPQLYCLNFSRKSVDTFKSYA